MYPRGRTRENQLVPFEKSTVRDAIYLLDQMLDIVWRGSIDVWFGTKYQVPSRQAQEVAYILDDLGLALDQLTMVVHGPDKVECIVFMRIVPIGVPRLEHHIVWHLPAWNYLRRNARTREWLSM